MKKIILITLLIVAIVIISLFVYFRFIRRPVITKEYIEQRLLEFKNKREEKLTQDYDLFEAEELTLKAKQAYDEGDYDKANYLLDQAFTALKKAVKSKYPRSLTLADLGEHPEERKNFENYYFIGVVHGDDGNRYGVLARINIPEEFVAMHITQLGVQRVYEKVWKSPINVFSNETYVKVEARNASYTLYPDKFFVEVITDQAEMHLEFIPRGYPFWYNKGQKAEMSTGMWGWGFEALSEINGRLVLNRKVINITKGYGTLEHFWGNANFDYWLDEEWHPINWYDGYALLFKVVDTRNNIYDDGLIYIVSLNKYFIVKSWDYDSPVGRPPPWESEFEITALTEEGAKLELSGIMTSMFDIGHYTYDLQGTFLFDNKTISIIQAESCRENIK